MDAATYPFFGAGCRIHAHERGERPADPAPRTLPQLESPQLLLDTIREFTESHAADEPG
jgi:hypothetical protein